MARIITFDDLSNKLFDEISWRKKELTIIKNRVPLEKSSLQSALLRSAIPLLYAHWEGFVKLIMSYYLEFVSNKYLNHNELKSSFIALSLQNRLGEINNNNIEIRTSIIEFIVNEFNSRSNIPKRNIINTKSNLKFDVLKEILFILDLNDAHIDGQKNLIDDLVDTRNHIAHGEYKIIDYQTFINFYTDIIALMEYLKTSIENNAIGEKYKNIRVIP